MSSAYKAIAHISYHIYELLPTGEMGKSLNKDELDNIGVKNTIKVIGAGELNNLAEKCRNFINVK